MKCQNCKRPATFHITELTDGKPQELHLCEEHAREYLTQSDGPESQPTAMAEAWAQQLKAVGQTAEELRELDQRSCPFCGITFFEFRKKGRLGCPHDYTCFEKELEPLLLNIHGGSEHTGKRPKRSLLQSEHQTELIRLRREMKDAVEEENYERASDIRDKIRKIKQGAAP